MRTSVRASGLEVSEALSSYLERRLAFALARFGGRIRSVTVHFADLNGPRGGVDKRCLMRGRLVPGGEVRAETTDSDLFAAIDRAAERLGQSVARELERRYQPRTSEGLRAKGRW